MPSSARASKSPREEHGEVFTLVDRDSEVPILVALQVVQSFDE